MKIRNIIENMTPSQKWLLRKKKVQCNNCGEINYEEDLQDVPARRHEPGYAVCPDCGHDELTDYSGDDRCPNCDAENFDGEECKNCGWN